MKDKDIELYEQAKRIFTDFLISNAYRKTPERFSVLKEIYMYSGHFDVEFIYNRMNNSKDRVSRATLYNTFELLLESNLIIKHQFGDNTAQYEKKIKELSHDHLICADTGKVIEFSDKRVDEIIKDVEKTYNVSITHHSLIFYGKTK